MMIVDTVARVEYTCYLSEEDEKIVRDYAEKHECSFKDAVDELCFKYNCAIQLYLDSTESDFSTEEIVSVNISEEE